METNKSYFGGVSDGLKSLLTGLGVTWREYFTPKVTEQYPENRKTQHIAARHRGRLIMPTIDKAGHNKCIACSMCEKACPNGTIKITSVMVTTAEGRKKKLLTDYQYDLGDCMFCELCVNACPHDAITFDNEFENSVFDRNTLIQHLNVKPSKEEMDQYAENARKAEEAKAAKAAAAAAQKAEADKKEEAK